ncbi:MAG: hypothetical protein GY750_08390 [Lentisphaerae bacterium]|nr:hypothetical protein [Lentisphaerota bacterium]MCP4101428.1 hypothetical protein [Lentisphaerota bacterium]
MKNKKILTILLLLFVLASFAYIVVKEVRASRNSLRLTSELPTEGLPQLVVYYFHGNTRCNTCRNIEGYTVEAVKNNFEADLKVKSLIIKPVNIELPENEHFIKDFNLTSKSVVLSKQDKGKQVKWKNLNKVWSLVGDKGKFTKYIKEEVGNFIK